MDGREVETLLQPFRCQRDAKTCVGCSSYLSHANCAHAYGRAISSSGFIDVATLRDRVSSESASSISSAGNGPLSVGIKPVRACSMLALLILCAKWIESEYGSGRLILCRC